jgi:hypothetical protein
LVALIIAMIGLGCLQNCATLQQVAAVMSNLSRLKFRLADVRDFSLMGIRISGKSRLADFSVTDGLRLVRAFASKSMPAEFVLNVEAVNPNDGSGGTPQTVSTLTSLESRLLIDGAPTVTGDIDRAIEIPGTGQAAVIPIRMSIDLYEFFGNEGYEGLVNIALALGGKRRDPARIALDAQPRVSTPMGPIVYPGRLTIVSREFR